MKGVAICLFTLLSTLNVWADPLAENQARFGVITGDVGLLAQGAPEWIEPHEGLPIEPGDHIRTGEDGRAELIMTDNVVWRLEPEGDFVAEHIETNVGRMTLSSGTLLGRVDSARTAGTLQQWDLTTPGCVVEIRGTEFALTSSKSEGTRLGVLEGEVEMQPAETAEGIRPPVLVSSGHEAVARRGRSVETLAKFSSRMQNATAKFSTFRRRHRQIENTWSPFTTTLRKELRRKFVAPPPKARPIRPRVNPRARKKKASLQDSY